MTKNLKGFGINFARV